MKMSIYIFLYLHAILKLINPKFNIFSLCQQSQKDSHILPFTSIKMNDDQILFTINKSRDKWHKLLSIDNVGTDAIVKFSKDHFGLNKCDYEIECYKYNIIASFDNVYSLLQNKKFPERVGMEYEEDNKIQTGIDVECSSDNFKMNESHLADNFKLSLLKGNSSMMKGINKFKKSISNFFADKNEVSEPTKNLREEMDEVKKEILLIEKEKEELKKNMMININSLRSNISKDKSFFENIWKIEIIAGMIGGIIVFSMFALYYYFNGIIQRTKSKPIN